MEKKQIVVTKQTEIKSGSGAKGPWTLWSVEATNLAGLPIEETLKSFDELPWNEPIEVEWEPQSHEQYGESVIVRMRDAPTMGQKMGELREKVRVLEERMDELKNAAA